MLDWKRWTSGLAVLPLGLTLACAEESPQEQLEAATEVMKAAQTVVEQATVRLQDHEAELVKAQEARDNAALALEEAEKSLAQAEAKVGMFATDDVLFRMVQQRLLDEPDLDDLAVQASVNDGRVTLTGSVPDEDARDTAVGIAEATPGVRGVTSAIRIEDPDSEPDVAAEADEAADAAEEVEEIEEAETSEPDAALPEIPMPEDFRAPLEEEQAAEPEART